VDSNGAEQPPEETTPDIAFTLGRSTMEPLWTFLDEHSDQPFFIWFAPTLPHTPFDAGPEFTRLYAGAGLSAGARAYYANITRFDAVVGQLLRRIDDSGLRERTLVVYLTDNGWDQEPKSDHAWHLGGPRGKFSIRDPGFRTPLVFRWPGWIEAGEVHDDLVSTVDLFPTLLGLAHIETPPGRMGVDLAPTLLNGDASPREAVMGGIRSLRTPNGRISNERAWFLRTHETRYVWYEKRDEEELFDLTRDPREESNIASEDPDLTRELRERLQRWIARAREPIH